MENYLFATLSWGVLFLKNVLLSYPNSKCGKTWLRFLIWLIFFFERIIQSEMNMIMDRNWALPWFLLMELRYIIIFSPFAKIGTAIVLGNLVSFHIAYFVRICLKNNWLRHFISVIPYLLLMRCKRKKNCHDWEKKVIGNYKIRKIDHGGIWSITRFELKF